ncbi:polynucleotidyl transferase, ribonuclease H-like superfamily protein [Carex rostrata]
MYFSFLLACVSPASAPKRERVKSWWVGQAMAGRRLLLHQRGSGAVSSAKYSFSSSSSCFSSILSKKTTIDKSKQGEEVTKKKVYKVKQVRVDNFAASLEALRPLISQAVFVAVDAEMTGISSAPWRNFFEWDSSAVRFLKLRDSASRFTILQFGVCPFTIHPSNSGFSLLAHPHNFYLFPKNHPEFLCQNSSLDFLATHHFDFNTCFSKGLSYLSRAQEEAQQLPPSANAPQPEPEEEDINAAQIDFTAQSTADLLFTQRIQIWLHEWREQLIIKIRRDDFIQSEKMGCKFGNFETTSYKMRPAVLLQGYTSHQLKLIRLVVRKHFSGLVFVRIPTENNMWESRVVYTHSDNDKASFLKELQMDLRRSRESNVTSAVGFRHVIDLLSSQNKLIVGHNCILDIAHMYDKFIGPIPSSMEEFMREVHKIFSNIIDTKHIMNGNGTVQHLMKSKSKSLSSSFFTLCPTISTGWSHRSASDQHVNVQVHADDDGSSWFNSGAKHEAGYDAFMTGCLFAQLCVHLGIKFDQMGPSISDPLQSNKKLKPYLNHLYPTWNSGTVVDFATGTEKPEHVVYKRKYPKVVFENIVLLWGFPSGLNYKNLKGCIGKVFGPDSLVSIFFIDSSSVLLQFKKEEFVKDFLILKETLERRKDDPISILHPLSVIFEGGNTKAGDYNTYKDVIACNSCKVLFKDQADASGVACKVDLGEKEERLFLDDDENISESFCQNTIASLRGR